MEQWKPIPEKPEYQVSDLGRVRGLKGQILRTKLLGRGYEGLSLGRYCYRYVHRLVAGAFIGEIASGMVVNHKNGVKTDNRLENLEVVSYSENLLHDYHVLRRKKSRALTGRGELWPYPRSKLTKEQVRQIRARHADGEDPKDLAVRYGITHEYVGKIAARKAWRNLD